MPLLPMFPLGTVLLPSVFLPLHVFEPRYRELVHDCLAGDREFGVVLITRGNEVGGGDTRESIGTRARILEATPFEDGRWAIGAVGTERIRVSRWLDDDPYPRAEVEAWPDGDATTAGPLTDALTERLGPVVATLRRVLAQRSELGDSVAAATLELSADPVLASFQASALSPFGPVDHQALLSEDGASARLAALACLLADEEAVLARRMALDAGQPGAVDDG